mmetsp:Transcript_22375/g.41672  ORF Transcript_22375/g.41672 Transcript_22375/m.41672 type:complete len:84 (-) Transcript_22375:400-651(-)
MTNFARRNRIAVGSPDLADWSHGFTTHFWENYSENLTEAIRAGPLHTAHLTRIQDGWTKKHRVSNAEENSRGGETPEIQGLHT